MADIEPTLELDCRGLQCPLPLLKTKQAIEKLATGDVLKVTATDPGMVADIETLTRRSGHELLAQSHGVGEYVFFLRKA